MKAAMIVSKDYNTLEFHLKDSFRFLGQITPLHIRMEYGEAHIFMFININQSCGLAVFEVMAWGVPVILSKSVGAVEKK